MAYFEKIPLFALKRRHLRDAVVLLYDVTDQEVWNRCKSVMLRLHYQKNNGMALCNYIRAYYVIRSFLHFKKEFLL